MIDGAATPAAPLAIPVRPTTTSIRECLTDFVGNEPARLAGWQLGVATYF